MSGGSWDYFYSNLDDVADKLAGSRCPVRKAFGKHLKKCAEAMKEVEWVDSGDTREGDEVASIKAALGESAHGLILDEARGEAERALARLQRAIQESKAT